ncbi:MAG: hypothetical protein HQL69_20200 [Magnetococcales bacterium]|nr:hypothetical protein [Magnetococcales bacterium]
MSRLFHVKRDANRMISSVSSKPLPGHDEKLPAGHPEIISFVSDIDNEQDRVSSSNLVTTDYHMLRIVEDLIEILVAKNIIKCTDLPVEAAAKLDYRRQLRGSNVGIELLDDDDVI